MRPAATACRSPRRRKSRISAAAASGASSTSGGRTRAHAESPLQWAMACFIAAIIGRCWKIPRITSARACSAAATAACQWPASAASARGVDVGRRADAAGPAVAQRCGQESLAAREHVETRAAEACQQLLRMAPVARRILDPDDGAGIGTQQALDQFEADAHLRNRRDVIQVDAQPPVADAIDDRREVPVQAFVGDALVVERRQHQAAGDAMRDRMRRKPDRIAECAAAGARHQSSGRNTAFDQPIEQRDPLVDRKRVRFRIRAEHREPDTLVEQPAAVPQQPLARPAREPHRMASRPAPAHRECDPSLAHRQS